MLSSLRRIVLRADHSPDPIRHRRTTVRVRFALLVAALALGQPSHAQDAPDYTTIDGIMTELYASVTRAPGEPFAWDRLRAIMLPGGVMLPQRAQTGGESLMMDVDGFIAMVDEVWDPVIGTPQDIGFFERQINVIVEEFGDVAHALTTYEKGYYEPRRILARGVNSVQLVKREGRWYVLSITWDEENTAGPLPPRYGGG
jgi:hypothetical protein